MVTLCSLWLPILISAAVVFVASFLAWMVLPHHKSEWAKLSDEQGFLDALRGLKVGPGQYIFPCRARKDLEDPEAARRYEQGPHGVLLLRDAKPNFGRNLALVFLFYVVVGVFVAYLATILLPKGSDYLKVFQVTGTAAIMAYVFGSIPNDIFFGRSLRSVINHTIDGIVYGLLTAGVFGSMWPAA